jgi:hypothetical protein
MIDNEFDPIPVRLPPDDRTPMGRIEGRDKRRYARLWGIDLDAPADDDGYPGGRADFDLCIKMMFCDHAELDRPHLDGGPMWRNIDLEEFAAAWRPPTESEMIEEEIDRQIAERIAEERARREAEAPDPETRH